MALLSDSLQNASGLLGLIAHRRVGVIEYLQAIRLLRQTLYIAAFRLTAHRSAAASGRSLSGLHPHASALLCRQYLSMFHPQ